LRWHPIGFGLAVLATTAIIVAITSDDGGTQTTTSAASASDSDAPGTIYYDKGTYYEKQADGTYKAVPPPPGATVSDLPQGYTSVWVAQDQYFYYQGQYYTEKDGKYVAAAAPVGAAVPYLPDDAEQKTEGGTTYYVWQDEYYVEVSQNGETQYMLTKVGSGSASRLAPPARAGPEAAARASPDGSLGQLLPSRAPHST
jgi:hypothetical protein